MKDNCKYFEKLFLNYINNSLKDDDQAFCSNHWKTCEKCKNNPEFIEAMQVWKKLDKWSDIQPSRNFMAKLQHEMVLLEEKQRVLWFKIDNFFNLFRVPLTSALIVIFSFTNNLPYAKAEKNYFKENTMKIEEKIKDYSNKSISEALKDFKKIIKK